MGSIWNLCPQPACSTAFYGQKVNDRPTLAKFLKNGTSDLPSVNVLLGFIRYSVPNFERFRWRIFSTFSISSRCRNTDLFRLFCFRHDVPCDVLKKLKIFLEWCILRKNHSLKKYVAITSHFLSTQMKSSSVNRQHTTCNFWWQCKIIPSKASTYKIESFVNFPFK